MAEKLTIKQDKFCMAYVETGNASEAYRQAYNAENMAPETIHVKACELLKNGKVAVKVLELQGEHRDRHDVTVDSLTRELDEDRKLARENGQSSAAISAVLGKAKLHGLMTDKQEISGKDGGAIEHEVVTTIVDPANAD